VRRERTVLVPLLSAIMGLDDFRSCIDACTVCAEACDRCASACIAEARNEDLSRCIQIDLDCAQICRAAAGFMARGSEHALAICDLCAYVCEACATECAKHAMEHCQACAAACRRAASECRRLGTQPPAWRPAASLQTSRKKK
jgi:hypothetical protein